MAVPAGYRLFEGVPTPEDYLRLRQAAGLGARSRAGAEMALDRGLYGVVVETPSGSFVGMGRIIGDLGAQLVLTDIAVFPEHQGQGVGRAIMDALMDWVRTHAAPCAFVSLISKHEAVPFYRAYGFDARGDEMLAMGLTLPAGQDGSDR